MYDQLTSLLEVLVKLEETEKEMIRSAFKPVHMKKNEFFLESGKVNKHIGFICKGLVRYFVYKEGEERTFEFTQENEFIADYQSFNSKKTSIQNIQAIEDSDLLIIDHPAVQDIFRHSKNGNLLGRLILEHRFDVMVNQLLAIYMQDHEERYRKFLKEYADLHERIPQYMIASFVGVQPQSLSRIRRRVLKSIS